jgi:hypothetical protein
VHSPPGLPDVRFGSKADICAATSHVRFTPNSDRESGFLLNDLRVLIRRCRIKAAFNISRDKGLELRVTHALHVDRGGGFELSRHQRRNHAHVRHWIGPGRGHQRRLAQREPALVQIG